MTADADLSSFAVPRIALLLFVSLVLGGLSWTPARAQIGAPPGPEHTAVPTPAPVRSAEVDRWRADLETLATELETRHADLFHSVSARTFRSSVTSLRDRIPTLARHEIVVGMMRIVASVGDGHTSVPVLFDAAAGFHALPLRLGLYEEGLFVEAASPPYEGAVGARIVAIGGVATSEAMGRVAALVSRDNDVWLRTMSPLFLAVTEILHALDLSEDPMAAELVVERDGRRDTVTVQAELEPVRMAHGAGSGTPAAWIDARVADPDAATVSPGASALRWKHPDRVYWSEYLAEHRTLYVQYDQVADAPHGPGVHAFFDEALATADRRPVDRLVLDLRDNSGGEGSLNVGVVKRILARRELDRPGRLFVLIGRRTFSAAQQLAHLLDRWTEAVFLGEPTGSSPQFYGDHAFFRLPNSGLLVSASPTWWQPGGPYDDRPFLPPRLAFEPRFEDYVAGRDPALEAVIAWDQRPTLEGRVLEPLARGDTAAAAEAVRGWSADPVNRYLRATAEINRLGYRLLDRGRGGDALRVFRLNLAVHPSYANGWDSLGEALLSGGRREEGLDAYRRAYELDPAVGRAAEVLCRETGRLPDRTSCVHP